MKYFRTQGMLKACDWVAQGIHHIVANMMVFPPGDCEETIKALRIATVIQSRGSTVA